MKTKFILKEAKDAYRLNDLVVDLITESRLEIEMKGGGGDLEEGIDFNVYDFRLNRKKVGHFEYRLRPQGYKIKFEIDIPEIYDQIVARITKLHPGLLEPVG